MTTIRTVARGPHIESPEETQERLRCEIHAGLRANPKTLPPKLFYDEAGSRLFEEITKLDEYYVTRTEREIMEAHAAEIAALIGPNAAYNDADGVTAAFNKNALVRLNREFGADFDVNRFRHYAYYNPVTNRVEMHLVSLETQTVVVDGERYLFEQGEPIWTESSYKYSPAELEGCAREAGLTLRQMWCDRRQWFMVAFFET